MIGQIRVRTVAGKLQQFVLIGFGVYPIFNQVVIGQEFQVFPQAPLQQPGERVDPEQCAHPFTEQHVERMYLPDVDLFMLDDILLVFLRVSIRIHEHRIEEGKR